MFEQILPDLHRFASRLSGPYQPVNSYIISSGQTSVLIDPAADLTPDAIAAAGLPPVAHILITHLQNENAAGCANFTDAEVHVPAGDEYLTKGRSAYEDLITIWEEPWEWETRGNYLGHMGGAPNERPLDEPLTHCTPLAEGDVVSGIRAIFTPGHGKNALTFVATINGRQVGFCGDMICGEGKLWNWFDSEWDYGLEGGPRALQASACRMLNEPFDLLCPTHGTVIDDPKAALAALDARLTAILTRPSVEQAGPINFPEVDSPIPGFRQILPHLHQLRGGGNCNVLVDDAGHALLIDDGLCFWQPLPERKANHRQVIADIKRCLGLESIEIVIPSHYHGDHTENIPDLIAQEGTQVVCLDAVANPMEYPERLGLACRLPWYGTEHDVVPVHRRMKSGERLEWRGYELEFFHLGGQTNATAGIDVIIDGVRTLFIGDSLGNYGAVPEPVLCYNDSEPATRGWAYAVDRMLERSPDLLVCGHSTAVRCPIPLLQAKQAAWAERIAQYRDLSFRDDPQLFFSPFV